MNNKTGAYQGVVAHEAVSVALARQRAGAGGGGPGSGRPGRHQRRQARALGVRSRSTSKVAPRDVGGLPPSKEVRAKAEKLRKGQQKALGRAARKGEGDRVHAGMMPKWLNRGKMSNGTRDWR